MSWEPKSLEKAEISSDSVIRWFKSSHPSHRRGKASFKRKQFLLLSFFSTCLGSFARILQFRARFMWPFLGQSGVSAQVLSIKPVLFYACGSSFAQKPRFCASAFEWIFKRLGSDWGVNRGVDPQFFGG